MPPGILSNCVSAEADTIFRGADNLQGIDALRGIICYIDHGKSIQLEQTRSEMETLHLRTIKNMESVANGIAEFELRLNECGEICHTIPDDEDKQSDFFNMLPAALREIFL